MTHDGGPWIRRSPRSAGFDDSFDQSNRIDLSELKKLFVGSSAAILRHR
jgi:hypothetical protein